MTREARLCNLSTMDALTHRLRSQLREAWKASGITLDEFATKIRKVNRECDYDGPALSRKLRGSTGMTVDEFDVFARALAVKLAWPKGGKS